MALVTRARTLRVSRLSLQSPWRSPPLRTPVLLRRRPCLHLPERRTFLQYVDFETEPIPGHDRLAELRPVHAGQIHHRRAAGPKDLKASTPPTCAMASKIRTPGMTGRPGKCP